MFKLIAMKETAVQLFKRIEKLPSAGACQEDVCNMLCSKTGQVHVCLCQEHRKALRAQPVLKDKEEEAEPFTVFRLVVQNGN